MKKNPYYATEELGSKMISFYEDLSYAYNTLIFLANGKGQVFTAQDSGCSCPTHFDDYEGETHTDVEQLMERVGSVDQAKQIFNTWNNNYNKHHANKSESEMEIEKFFKEHFTLCPNNRLADKLRGA